MCPALHLSLLPCLARLLARALLGCRQRGGTCQLACCLHGSASSSSATLNHCGVVAAACCVLRFCGLLVCLTSHLADHPAGRQHAPALHLFSTLAATLSNGCLRYRATPCTWPTCCILCGTQCAGSCHNQHLDRQQGRSICTTLVIVCAVVWLCPPALIDLLFCALLISGSCA